MPKTITIFTKYDRILLYKHLCHQFSFDKIYFSKNISQSFDSNHVFVDEYFFLKKKQELIKAFINFDKNFKVYIIFWNGFLDQFRYRKKIISFKKLFCNTNFIYIGKKTNKHFPKSFLKLNNKSMKNEAKIFYKSLYLKLYISKFFNTLSNIFYIKKIKKFKNDSKFIFIGKWDLSKKEIEKFLIDLNQDKNEIIDFLNKINYFDNDLFYKNSLVINSKNFNKFFFNKNINYYLYNLIIRKKIILSLMKKKLIFVIDDYSKPDFLNKRFKIKSIFLDFGSKYGSNSFYPRHIALKINYPNNKILINFFNDRIANFKNLKKSFLFIGRIDKKIKTMKISNINNLNFLNEFNV